MFWIPNITTIILAWLVQCVILSGHIWFEEFKKLEKIHFNWLIKGLQGFIFVVFTVVAMVFIDTNIKLIFFGIAGYGNFVIYISSIVLTFVLTAEIIMYAFLIAPNLKGIIIFCFISIFFLYWFEFYLNEANLGEMGIIDLKYSAIIVGIIFPILVGLIGSLVLTGIEKILKKVKPFNSLLYKQFWNMQVITKRIFNIRFNFVLWALITVELILNLQGLSLLLWITLLF